MIKTDLIKRTRKFALDCMLLCIKLPNERAFNAYINQLIRCSSSVGANYRASQKAKSKKDFINKLKIVEEEVDEANYFLDLLNEVSKIYKLDFPEFEILLKESKELLAIITSSINTARKNENKK